jgi:hypothetical protein
VGHHAQAPWRLVFLFCTLCAAMTAHGVAEAAAQSSNVFFQKNGWTGAIIMNNQAPAGCGVFADVARLFVLQ